MLRKNPSGHLPQVSPLAYIDPTAIICGRVIVEDFVYVGPCRPLCGNSRR